LYDSFVGLPKVFCCLGYNVRKEFHFHTPYGNITNGDVEEDNRSFSLGHWSKEFKRVKKEREINSPPRRDFIAA
jgi:hypothetical protein